MDQSLQQQTHDIELMRQLDRYFPGKLRVQIEQDYYAKVNDQAQLDCVARNEEFLANPLNHVALFSDHGVVHVRDVATNIVPSLKYISLDERKRYLVATESDWSLDVKEKVLVRVAQSGHKIHNIDPERAFTDVRLTSLREGEILILAGAPPGFVYVPMEEGLLSTPLGGYQAHSVKSWIPLGNTRVIRGDVQEATITAEQELKVLMIPKEIYLKYWHDTYNIEEFSQLLPRVYAEDKMKGLEQIFDILQQVALIDEELDDAEVAFIQKFIKTYGLDYSAAELREKLLAEGKSDFISLRQSVLDYLAVDPPYLQVGQLRDLLNLFAKADEEITEEEVLILSELNGLFASYLDEGTGQSPYQVWMVPQSPEQNDAITSLLPDLPKEEIAGGFAYFVGSYYSQDYADMICDKYRTLQFFTFVDQENGKES